MVLTSGLDIRRLVIYLHIFRLRLAVPWGGRLAAPLSLDVLSVSIGCALRGLFSSSFLSVYVLEASVVAVWRWRLYF